MNTVEPENPSNTHDDVNVIIGPFCFHKKFVENYRGLTVVQTRRKMKPHYTRAGQDLIIRWLKENRILKEGNTP